MGLQLELWAGQVGLAEWSRPVTCSWALPSYRGPSCTRTEPGAQHQQPIPARQHRGLCSEAVGDPAGDALCVLFPEFWVSECSQQLAAENKCQKESHPCGGSMVKPWVGQLQGEEPELPSCRPWSFCWLRFLAL